MIGRSITRMLLSKGLDRFDFGLMESFDDYFFVRPSVAHLENKAKMPRMEYERLPHVIFHRINILYAGVIT